MHTAELFVPEPEAFYFEVAIGNLKRHKSPDVDQFSAELIQAGAETLRSETQVDLEQRIASLVETAHGRTFSKKGDTTDYVNYRGISFLSTSYKFLSNILLSRLPPYVDEIIGDHQCGF
jgi:hypothetical protein